MVSENGREEKESTTEEWIPFSSVLVSCIKNEGESQKVPAVK